MLCEMSSVACQPAKQPGILNAKDVSFSSRTEIARSSKCSKSDGFNLTFKQLRYKVRTGAGFRFKRNWKYILKQINGEFISGELTGIIGPSGSGKTTLMDILAGYTISGVEGKVLFNGVKGRLARYDGCYIMQDGQLQPLFTVLEAITFAAHLKLGSSISWKEKKQMANFKQGLLVFNAVQVLCELLCCNENQQTLLEKLKNSIDSILESLYLTDCYHTLTHKLSGGQRKRLSIGLELLTNPPVMFFDEPTSGLDICSSKQCLGIMKSLAAENRIVVCSLHQPSALLLEMFDHLYAMAGGECIYQGSISNIIPYLSSLGFNCPRYYNPADFVLELPFEDSIGVLSNHQRLVNGSANGICDKWRKSYTHNNASSQNISICSTNKNGECRTENHGLLISHNKILHHNQCSTSLCYQILILLNRTFIRLYREKFFMPMRLSLHVLFGCFIGLFYRGIGNDAAHVIENFSLLFFCLMFLMFTAFSAMIMAFPSELPIITREYFNCWYSLKSYYLAVVIADVTFQMICTFIYCLLVYLISFQPRDIQRFVMFTLMYILVSLVSQGMGLFVGASMRVQHGMVFGPLFISPWVIFSGFFLHLNDAAPFFHWIFHISFLKHGLEGVMDSIYGNNRSRLPCSEDYCHFVFPKKLLKELDMIHNGYWTNFYILSSYVVVLYTITYFMLKYQVCHKR